MVIKIEFTIFSIFCLIVTSCTSSPKDTTPTIFIDTSISSFNYSSKKENGIFSKSFLSEYSQAKLSGDVRKELEYSSMLAADALNRALMVEQRWVSKIQQPIGLFPRNESPKWQKWLGRDNAADCLPYLIISAYFLDRENYSTWLKVLDRQTELCNGLSCWLDLATGEIAFSDPEEIAFDTAELLKDGYLPLLEWLGHEPFLSQSVSMANKLMLLCQRQTSHGLLCARRSEINGDLMMVLSRLWLITNDDNYREFVKKLVSAYVYDVFPKYGGLFPEKLPAVIGTDSQYSLVMGDHANEILQGFADYCYALSIKSHPDAQWCLQELNSLINISLAATPRGPEGLWFRKAHIPRREKDTDARTDVWGYLINTFRVYDYLTKTQTYESETKRILEGVLSLKDYPWENDYYDGYADTIESMIYSLPYLQEPKYEQWIDTEVQRMFSKQKDNGTLDGGYLEGNFIRTAMLYGLLKSKGIYLENWRSDLAIAATENKKFNKLYISVSAKSPWQGMLQFDHRRHLDNMNLKDNYPRINTTPEWFTVKPDDKYEVVVNGKNIGIKNGSELLKGIHLDIQ